MNFKTKVALEIQPLTLYEKWLVKIKIVKKTKAIKTWPQIGTVILGLISFKKAIKSSELKKAKVIPKIAR